MQSLFPFTYNWSWGTFFLYISVSYVVVCLCKKGAKKNKHGLLSKHVLPASNLNACYLFAVLILTILATIRSSSVGTDTHGYVNEFLAMSDFYFDWKRLFTFQQIEPGYQLLILFVRKLTQNYHILFFVVFFPLSIAYITFIKYFYSQVDQYCFLPLFIFYFVSNMSGMRAALGTIFLIYSFIALSENRFFKANILTLIACTFHYTMMFNFYIVFVSWLFKQREFRRRRWLWILGFCASFVFANYGIATLLSIIEKTKYGYYSGADSLWGSIVFIIHGIVAVWLYRRIYDNDKEMTLLVVSLSFLITYPMIYVVGAYRIPNYYILPRLFIWDSALSTFCNESTIATKRIVKVGCVLIVAIYILFRFSRASVDGGFVYTIT